jgi:hypothetical protein
MQRKKKRIEVSKLQLAEQFLLSCFLLHCVELVAEEAKEGMTKDEEKR